jgi:hypothetical protein
MQLSLVRPCDEIYEQPMFMRCEIALVTYSEFLQAHEWQW